MCVLVSFWIRRRNADCFCVIAAFLVATGELYDLKALLWKQGSWKKNEVTKLPVQKMNHFSHNNIWIFPILNKSVCKKILETLTLMQLTDVWSLINNNSSLWSSHLFTDTWFPIFFCLDSKSSRGSFTKFSNIVCLTLVCYPLLYSRHYWYQKT